MKEKMKEEKISDALLKVALGYQVAEVTEEYAEVDGELKLTKRKKTKKDVPPDLKAVQLLLSSENSGNYADWTDEELQAEKQRLLAELQAKQTKEETLLCEGGEGVKTTRKMVVKEKKVAGSVELNVKKAPIKAKKSTAKSAGKSTAKMVKSSLSAAKK